MFTLDYFLREQREAHRREAIVKLVEKAKGGDMEAHRKLLEDYHLVIATPAQVIELNQRLRAHELKTHQPWLYQEIANIFDQHL